MTTTTITPQSQPTVAAGASGAQAAGNWAVSQTGGTVNNGDQIVLTVGPAACASGAQISFSGTPTVSAATVASGTAPTWTAAVSSAGSGCSNNVLTLTAAAPSGGASPSSFTVSGVQYAVGPNAAAGPVPVAASGNAGGLTCAAGPAPANCSNATVSPVVLTANNPAVSLAPTGAGQAISNFVVTEGKAGAVAAGNFVCFTITSPNTTFTPVSSTNPAPTVSASSGSGAVANSPTEPTNTQVAFQVPTASSTAPATFTVSGLKLDTNGATGPVQIAAGQGATLAAACGTQAAPTTNIGSGVTAGAVLTVKRFGGGDRFDTARLIGDAKFPCAGAPTASRFALLARGDKFPDALAGSYLAGKKNAPVLLTDTDTLSDATRTAFREMGISDVIVLGLQGAVSDAVVSQIQSIQAVDCTGAGVNNAQGNPQAIRVSRIGGTDRYETAKKVAEFPGLGAAGTLANNGLAGTGVPTAILATGEQFPDALAAGPVAFKGTNAGNGAGGLPLLLTNQAALNGNASQALNDMGIKQVIIPGGSAAVSDAVANSLTSAGINVIRVAGADRTDTAAKMAAFETAVPSATVAGLGYNTNIVQLARGDNFPDALAGGPYAGVTVSPILLTSTPDSIGSFTGAYLQAHNTIHGGANGISKLVIFGGVAAVDANAQGQAESALSS